ncbi:HalOD1 output domain-containing protein [Haladaptatus caseinilyticus]|uniref:HalOD1 output domain-containing protein n=1 Tax=Haladaptatus caseinilyticus TaxID=2993314 RepID=UPI00224B3DF0|nr:HalOD1 output domain-containing protein [Haladaptatus caseinilyticus]
MRTDVRRRPNGQDGDQPSLAVLSAVMDRAGYDDATDFDTCLYDVIDPDALDALFHRRTRNARVEFSLDGYTVHVHSSGAVEVLDE